MDYLTSRLQRVRHAGDSSHTIVTNIIAHSFLLFLFIANASSESNGCLTPAKQDCSLCLHLQKQLLSLTMEDRHLCQMVRCEPF